MNCEAVKKYLPFYYYNDLNETTTLKIKSHIKNCSSCQKEFYCFKKMTKLVSKEEKIKLPRVYRQALLNRVLEACDLKKERGILQTRRVFAFGSGIATAMLLFFSIFLSTTTVGTDRLNWQNDPFAYGVEELNKQITKTGEITPQEPLQISGYSLDEKIDNTYEEIEELMAFLNYNP